MHKSDESPQVHSNPKSKTARAKVIVDIYITSYIVFHERDLRKQLFAHHFLYENVSLPFCTRDRGQWNDYR